MRTIPILEVLCDGCDSTEAVRGEMKAGSVSKSDAARELLKRGWAVQIGSRRYENELPANQLARGSLTFCPNCAVVAKASAPELDGLREIIREELVKLLSERVS